MRAIDVTADRSDHAEFTLVDADATIRRCIWAFLDVTM